MLNFLMYIQSFASPLLDKFLTVFNFLSQQYFLVLLVAVVYWAVDKKKGEQLSFNLIFTICLSCGIKGVFKVPRPYTYDGIRVLNKKTAPGFSFPSADSSAAASIASTFATWTKKPVLWVLLGVYTLLIGFCRMYFGLHFPTDVLGGFAIGCLVAFGSHYIFSKAKNDLSVYIISTLLLIPFIFFGQETDYYKTLGLMVGACLGIIIEKKFVNFSNNISVTKKVCRVILGVLGIVIIAVGFPAIFPDGNFFEFTEKFLMTFFAVGIYPAIFKKFNF